MEMEPPLSHEDGTNWDNVESQTAFLKTEFRLPPAESCPPSYSITLYGQVPLLTLPYSPDPSPHDFPPIDPSKKGEPSSSRVALGKRKLSLDEVTEREDKTALSNREAGASYEDISKILPARTTGSHAKRISGNIGSVSHNKHPRWLKEELNMLAIPYSDGANITDISKLVPSHLYKACIYRKVTMNLSKSHAETDEEKLAPVSLIIPGLGCDDMPKTLEERTSLECNIQATRTIEGHWSNLGS